VHGKAPILVVGGRTTGLTMACELARHGAPLRIVDKSPGIDPHCRASGIHSRTLEVFQDLGIVDEVLAAGSPISGMNQYAHGRRLVHARYDDVDSPYPYAIALGQNRTEEILEGLLTRLGLAVERQTELVSLVQHADRVSATLQHADGRQEVVDTPWLVGCDGAHSQVRHVNRQHFPGEADPHQYALADVFVDAPIARDEWHSFLTERGVLFFFPLQENRTVVAAELHEHHPHESPTLEDIQRLVAERGPKEARISDPRWLTYFHINYRLARHYRHGRTFLAGDAVHVHSLLGGQGMNTGIQDAYNLAWKLALVTRGRAPESLLDSYEKERRGVAADVVEMTRRMTEQVEAFSHLSAADREKVCVRMAVAEPERLSEARHREELDLDYRKSPICTQHVAGNRKRFGDGPHAGAQAPDAGKLRVAGRAVTLYELLQGAKHTLLLFVGPTHEQAAWNRLTDLAAATIETHGDRMNVHVVTTGNGTERADLPAEITIVDDPEQTLHNRYGAETECLYLIRPDGYVGYRSAPATASRFRKYLDRVYSSV
jgi:2-polyprenyl-6-methoxyphenol hydroxylase-like FAD-dependent oxidoreductase